MIAVRAGDGTDQGHVLHLLGQHAGRFPRSDAGDARLDRLELAPRRRPGLGSHVSMWLMPPPFQNRITCFGWAAWSFPAAASSLRTFIPRNVALLAASIERRVKAIVETTVRHGKLHFSFSEGRVQVKLREKPCLGERGAGTDSMRIGPPCTVKHYPTAENGIRYSSTTPSRRSAMPSSGLAASARTCFPSVISTSVGSRVMISI